jgi:hypothetical protein
VTFWGGLLLAVLAQWFLSYCREFAWIGGAAYAMALVLFAGSVIHHRSSLWLGLKLLFVTCAVGSVIWAAHLAHVRHDYGRAASVWGAGVALAIVASLGVRRWRLRVGWWREAVAVGCLFIVALALRLVRLGRFPDLMLGDEGSMAMDAARVLRGDPVNPFGVGWFAHPSLFFYLEAAGLHLFGWNLFGLRFAAALLGALGVPAVYVLAKGVWGRQVAWVSAFFLAGWGLSLQLSRLALNNSADPLFGALVLAGLHRGLTHGRRWGFVVAGLMMGMGMYFYYGTRLLIPLVPLMLAFAGARRLRKRWRGILVFVLLALVVAGPLLVDFILSPGVFLYRQETIGIGGTFYRRELEREQMITGDPLWLLLAKRVGRAVFPFVYARDEGFFYSSNEPMLYVFSGVLFVLGVGLALINRREARYAVMLGWLGLMVLLGGILLTAPPQYQRYLIAAPAVCMLVGRAAVVLVRWVSGLWGWRRVVSRGAVLCAALALLIVNVAYYFGVYAPSGTFGDRDTEIADRTARLMADLGPGYTTYFFSAYMTLESFSSVRFLAPEADWVEVVGPPPVDWTFVQTGQGALFVLLQERADELPLLRELFPGGVEQQIVGRNGETLFTVYRVDSVVAQPSTEGDLR